VRTQGGCSGPGLQVLELVTQSRRSDAIANRARLLDAARVAFAEFGPSAEVTHIAERAGVGIGTIYRHFGSKEGLLREVVLEAVAEFERELGDSERSAEPVAALRAFLIALLHAADSYGWLFDAMLSGQLPEEASQGIEGVEAGGRISAVLQRGVTSHAFRGDLDVEVAANLLLGLPLTWKYGELRESMTNAHAVDRTITVFLAGAIGGALSEEA
jgi:AcrR family transcriptional regulator